MAFHQRLDRVVTKPAHLFLTPCLVTRQKLPSYSLLEHKNNAGMSSTVQLLAVVCFTLALTD